MIFTNDKAIYIQIADRLCDEILSGVYKDDDHIPSVREYSVLLEVNTNTAVKAYEQLAREEIIYNKRGLGYFVTKGAKKQILKARKQEFMRSACQSSSDRCAYWIYPSRISLRNGRNNNLSSQIIVIYPINFVCYATFSIFAASNRQN